MSPSVKVHLPLPASIHTGLKRHWHSVKRLSSLPSIPPLKLHHLPLLLLPPPRTTVVFVVVVTPLPPPTAAAGP